MLSVKVGPRAGRRILEDGPRRNEIEAALARIKPEADLAGADAVDLARMAEFYSAVKIGLSDDDAKRSNPWVTASKLCARKRPALFPVRDNNVCNLLGLSKYANYEIDWQVFRHLITTPEVFEAIDAVQDAVRALGGPYRVDRDRLRILDAALWTYTLPAR